MTILIAGFGDLGHAIARQALEDERWRATPILALRRSPPDLTGLPNVRWCAADLMNVETITTAIQAAENASPISHVVYCAAPNERTEQAYRRIYVNGLQNVVNAFKAHACQTPPMVLFVSSTAVYDSQSEGVFNESSPTEPRGFNGQVLCQAESWLLENSPRCTVLRLSGIYGPGKQRLLDSIARGMARVPADNHYVANRIHLEDAARAVLHLLGGGHHGVFIGSDNCPLPLATLYANLAEMLDAPPPQLGEASPMMGKKRLSNQKLLDTGFTFKWPDSLTGYAAIIKQSRDHR